MVRYFKYWWTFLLLTSIVFSERVPVMTNGTMNYLQTVAVQEYNGLLFMHLRQFGEAIQAKTIFNPQESCVELEYAGHSVRVCGTTSFLSIDDSIINLHVPARTELGAVLVPLNPFMAAFNERVSDNISYNRNLQRFEINLMFLNIVGLEIHEKSNGTEIHIATTKLFNEDQLEFVVHPDRWSWLMIEDGRLDSVSIANCLLGGAVKKIEPIQMEKFAQISFQLREEVQTPEIYINENPNEIVISLRTPVSQDTKEKISQQERTQEQIKFVVLDAGHGGRDPGAEGKRGLREKDVTLAVVKRLGKKIEERLGLAIEYTRTTDKFIELHKRTRFANDIKEKYQSEGIFISIHCNASGKNRKANGYETYFLRPGKTKDATEVAKRENSVIQFEVDEGHYEAKDDEIMILASMATNSINHDSEEFATFVQTEMGQRLASINRGIKQAGFYVLVGAQMPNVLVEIGFISNPQEEQRMKTDRYLDSVAESLYQAVRKYVRNREKNITN